MKRPPTSFLIAGHPLVAVPGMLLFGGLGGLSILTGQVGWPTLIVLVLATWFLNCMKAASAYRDWRREWDALDPNYRPWTLRHTFTAVRKIIIGAACGCCTVWLIANFGHDHSPAHWIAPLVLFLLVGLTVLGWLRPWRPRRQHSPRDFHVAQAISRPLPAPSAAEAYARLPDYCRPLFSSEPRKEPS